MRSLKDEGYSFKRASNGQEALRVYDEERPDLVITDRGMPVMGGLEFVKRLMAKDPGAKVIVVSGGISQAETAEFLSSGAMSVMTKPFDIEEMQGRVSSALKGAKGGFGKAEPANEGVRKQRCLRVLFVDDDDGIREAMQDVIPTMGHTLATAANGKEALEAIAAGSFDVVVSDYHMPVMDGLEMLRRIKKDNPDLPVIMVFAARDDSDARGVRDAGAFAVLPKPVDLERLEKAIADSCGG